MHSHLVTVEVSVECCTHEWVNLNGFAFNEYGLECLNTQTVKRGCTVQQHWVFANDFFEDVPHAWMTTFDHALGALNVLCVLNVDKTLHHEWLEEFESHQLGQTTLMQTQRRSGHDD